MKILIDECLPVRVKKLFNNYNVYTVRDLKWNGIKNGSLLKKAINDNFDVFITVDKKLRYQQDLEENKISFIILDIVKNKHEEVLVIKDLIIEALNKVKSSEIIIVNPVEGLKILNKG